jgi:hypothetical protein
MATYALYNASFGASYANTPVKIFDTVTQAPAIVMASATGGLVNSLGVATLDSSGNLAAYLDSSKTWQVDLYPIPGSTASSSNTQESTQLLVKTAVQTIATNTAGGGGGSATSALQTTGNTSLASIDTKLPAKGSANSANSTPVVIASDQAAVPVTVSGVSTAANQTTGNTSLATIATNTTGASTAANQTTGNTSLATIATNTTGAATSAKQDTGNTSLATIAAAPIVATAVVKAASTAAVATDPALVVALSPNNPVTVGAPADVSTTSTNITAQNLNVSSGTATANSTISIALNGQAVVVASITANTLGAQVTAQISYDGSNWQSLSEYTTPTNTPQVSVSSATIATSVTGAFQWKVAGAKAFRLSANSATVSGTLTASLNASVASATTVTTVNLTQYNSSSTASTLGQVGGSANASLGVVLSAPTHGTDVSSTSWSASSGNSSTIADGVGGTCSMDINLSAYTGGSAVGIDIWLQWSPDGGTTWYDYWQVERLTAAGHAFIPAIMLPGRRRYRWINVNSSNTATAATTATVVVTATRLSISPATVQRQWFDRTAGALAGTVSTATAWYDVSGCTSVTGWVPLGVASGPASYQLQFSADQVNILPASASVAAVASATTAYTAAPGMAARFARIAVTTASTSQTSATAPIVITGS